MLIKKEFQKGKYITATTRRSNYTDCHYAKYTIWPSRKNYENGNCEGAITYTGLYLGPDLTLAEKYIMESAKSFDTL